MARPVSQDIVGLEGKPVDYSWTEKDVMLYACGVGARPYDDVDFLFEGKGPAVLPTYCVIPGMAGMAVIGELDINPVLVLHGEEAITLHKPLPPSAKISMTAKVVEVFDKGSAAVVGIETTALLAGDELFTVKASLFARGAGGFGGDRGPSTKGHNEPPDRTPDHVVEDVTRVEQAGIYRLSGDYNPLHIDPEFAKMGGFDTPILHGLCTYGFAGRAILKALCDNDPARFKHFEARFADVVYPGETIVTKMWVDGNEAIVQAETKDKGNVVLSQAKAVFS